MSGVEKTFTMHLQGGQRLPVLTRLAFEVHAGECVALGGASGAGKSSILKMVYGNYAVTRGRIELHAPDGVIDIAAAGPRQVLAARRRRGRLRQPVPALRAAGGRPPDRRRAAP